MGKIVTLFTDGASRGNPGPASCGFVVFEGDSVLAEDGVCLGETTNNVAEYQGVLKGLQLCLTLDASDITLKSDSELLVKQLRGEYKVKAPQLKPLFQQIKTLIGKFERVKVTHVPRELNKLADKLANQALDGLL